MPVFSFHNPRITYEHILSFLKKKEVVKVFYFHLSLYFYFSIIRYVLNNNIAYSICGKSILITGGTGSFGKSFTSFYWKTIDQERSLSIQKGKDEAIWDVKKFNDANKKILRFQEM